MNKVQKKLILHIGKRHQIYSQTELVGLVHSNKKTVSYNLRKLISNGFIAEIPLGRIKNYRLTTQGKNYAKSKLLTLSDTPRGQSQLGQIDRVHDIRIRCKIIRKPTIWSNACEYKIIPMRNWNKYIRRMEGIVIEASNTSIIYRIDEIFDRDPQLALDRAFELIRNVNTVLINENPRLVLGEPECAGVVFYQHHGFQNDPFATWCKENNIQARFKDVRVDVSHGIPELEVENNLEGHDMARNYLKFARDIMTEKIDPKDLTNENLGNLGVNVERMTGFMDTMSEKQGEMIQQFGQMVTGNLSTMQHNDRTLLKIMGMFETMRKESRKDLEDMRMRLSWTWKVKHLKEKIFGGKKDG